MPAENEVWAEIEKLMFEELPELLEGFDAMYKAPIYHLDPKNRASCSRCGAMVDKSKMTTHSQWHRALSLRIHSQMALMNFVMSLVKEE